MHLVPEKPGLDERGSGKEPFLDKSCQPESAWKASPVEIGTLHMLSGSHSNTHVLTCVPLT